MKNWITSLVAGVFTISSVFHSTFGATTTKTKNGYKLTINNLASNVPTSTVTNYMNTFFNVYPKQCYFYNENCCTNAIINIDPNYNEDEGPAEARWEECTIWVGAEYAAGNPDDWDIITHESFHLLQNYINAPHWIVEGFADFARDEFGVNNNAAGWSLPTYESGMHYTEGYGETASFFKWLEDEYPGSTWRIEQRCRTAAYKDSWWKTETGKTITELWSEYVDAKSTIITFYTKSQHKGTNIEWKGAVEKCQNFLRDNFNDKVTSLDIGDSCIFLYKDEDCTGDEIKLKSDCSEEECPCQHSDDLTNDCSFSKKATSHRLC